MCCVKYRIAPGNGETPTCKHQHFPHFHICAESAVQSLTPDLNHLVCRGDTPRDVFLELRNNNAGTHNGSNMLITAILSKFSLSRSVRHWDESITGLCHPCTACNCSGPQPVHAHTTALRHSLHPRLVDNSAAVTIFCEFDTLCSLDVFHNEHLKMLLLAW